MRYLVIISLCLTVLAAPLTAQDSEQDDRGYLQALLEDNLSGEGRRVQILGFEGALSSNATVEEIIISDATGMWLTLKDVKLVWTRTALLSGRIKVNELTAAEILLPRLPGTSDAVTPEDTEAKPFALPDLPVSIDIGEIRADKVVLGAPVLGEEVTLSVNGNMNLGGGEGHAALNIDRKEKLGKVALDANFSNESNILKIKLDVEEEQGGIIAKLIDLPGHPALQLSVKGEDPLDDYTAEVALASDGEPRLSGTVSTHVSGEDTAQTRVVAADISGDLAPLFAAEFRPFFGHETALRFRSALNPDGSFDISDLSIDAAALQLTGHLALDADKWPQSFDLQGRIGDGKNLIRLPSSGTETQLRQVKLEAEFDAEKSRNWIADIVLSGLEQPDLTVKSATLKAQGQISPADAPRAIAGEVFFTIRELLHADPALAEALGKSLDGRTDFNWREGQPLEIAGLDVTGGNANLKAEATLDSLGEGFPVKGKATLTAEDLSRFAAVAGRDLGGAAQVQIAGEAQMLSGAFDTDILAVTRDLQTGTDRIDPVLRGESRLAIDMRRDTDGIHLDSMQLRNEAASADLAGRINSESGELNIDATLKNVALVEPRLNGAATVTARVNWMAGGDVTLSRFEAALEDNRITGTATLSPEAEGLPLRGRFDADIASLARFAKLTGQNLRGALDITLEGSGTLKDQSFEVKTRGTGSNIRIGNAQVDQLLRGDVSFDVDAGRNSENIIIRNIRAETPQLRLSATGQDNPGAPVAIDAWLADVGLFADGINGPLSAKGNVQIHGANAQRVTVNLNANGPGGITARVTGRLDDFAQQLDLALNGKAPLGLANAFIAPRSVQGTLAYDLDVNGAPALSSVSGNLQVSNTSVSLPMLGQTIEGLNGTINMRGGNAQLDLQGRIQAGGGFTVSGPISLTPGNNADLAIPLNNIILTDGKIYTTTLRGNVRINGPLAGGATIGGRIDLGETEIRIPSGGSAAIADLPGLRHVNTPPGVQATRRRAGLIDDGSGGGSAGRPYPLDLVINAPNRIFVRGRGLDSELGGRLILGGTTADVNASGLFELIRGRFDILGKRLDLTEGTIDLRGALDPYLRFVAETTADDTLINIIIEGLASDPTVTFRSQPELPQEEVVSRLLFSRGLDNITPFQAAKLAAAVATLAGKGGGGVMEKIREGTGLSDFDVTQNAEGETEVSAGAYITDDVYSEVQVDSAGRRQINLNYDINKSFTAKGSVDNEGGTGLGLFFEKDY